MNLFSNIYWKWKSKNNHRWWWLWWRQTKPINFVHYSWFAKDKSLFQINFFFSLILVDLRQTAKQFIDVWLSSNKTYYYYYYGQNKFVDNNQKRKIKLKNFVSLENQIFNLPFN